MNQQLDKICEEFIENRDIIKDEFHWQNSLIYPACAYIFLAYKQVPNAEMLQLCRAILKEYAGWFSYFRGNGELIFTSFLATSNDPGAKMEMSSMAYEALKEFFSSSSSLPLAAMILSDYVSEDKFETIAYEADHIYRRLKEGHFWITGEEDVCFAVLLALYVHDRKSGFLYDEMVEEIDFSFDQLKRDFRFHGNAMQSLSHVLYMCDGSPEQKLNNVNDLYDELEDAGLKYGKDYEMVALGILANLGIEKKQIVLDLLEIDDFLKDQEGYGFFGFSRRTRLLHSVMICAAYYMNETTQLTSAFILAVLLEIRAQQAAAAAAAA